MLIPIRRKVFSEKRQLAFFAKDVADSLPGDPQLLPDLLLRPSQLV
jgi:hypothetical protein